VILADVNVLIYAFRADTPRHALCRSWLERIIMSEIRFGLSPLVLSAVARITTNPRIFRHASPIEEAFAYCDNLLSQPNCEVVQPGGRHWAIFRRLCVETDIRGPRVTDAWFAALAMEHGCIWITCDSDYRRFPGLDCAEPH
jgi:uncharacterized protein